MNITRRVLIPTTLAELVGPNRAVLEEFGVNVGNAVETALYAWPYKENQTALYDLLAEQLMDDHVALGDCAVQPYSETFDRYYDAITDTMRRVEPHLYNQDLFCGNVVDHIKVIDVQGKLREPYLIAELNFEL